MTIIAKHTLKRVVKCSLIVSMLVGLLVTGSAMAQATSGVSLTTIGDNVGSAVSSLAKILSNVALIAGIGFILAAFFKFHQHKLNPTQVPISQGVTLLIIGAGLTLFPIIIPSTTKLISKTAKVSSTKGTGISGLINR